MGFLTRLLRGPLTARAREARSWKGRLEEVQRAELARMVRLARRTLWGRDHGFARVESYEDFIQAVPQPVSYERLRPLVMRMIAGEADVLWPGVTRRFAQSSGTSDGKSKYIPVTDESLRRTHFRGTRHSVAHYLEAYPDSSLLDGRAFILGGSFANELTLPRGVRVGDLSANLIDSMPSGAGLLRVPRRDIALMADWRLKLPALIEASARRRDITNISGVPSWFLTVLKGVLEYTGAATIHDVWPRLEVFFHGGIAFGPYREQYRRITDPSRMRYLENYNASEGFFAVQDNPADRAMLMLLDAGTFYEFMPLDQVGRPEPRLLPSWEVEAGKTYALVISGVNGLWRYEIGDTVRVCSTDPLKITIAGRTRHFINAFGEELMVSNADGAIEEVCRALGCDVANYTAAPVYAGDHSRGRHQWLVEFSRAPRSLDEFARRLDTALQARNSDYQAKRTADIFLAPPEVVVARKGLFDAWLASTGKLGGQRKVPRLANSREFIDPMLNINNQSDILIS